MNFRSSAYAGHTKTVNGVAWSRDGALLGTASSDFSTRVWAVRSGALTSVLELAGHKKNVMQLCWDPTRDNFLATASNDRTVRVWDVRAARSASVVETKGENINLTYTRDGSAIVVGNKKDLLTWIDVRTLKVVGEVSFPSETNEFAYDVSGELFFATTGKGTVDIYQGDVVAGTFKRALSLPAHAARCQSISFSPNGKWFAVGSVDSLVSMWDRAELVCLRTMCRFKAAPRSISYSHDSQYLASGGEDGFIDVAHSTDGSQVAAVRVGAAINALAWNPSSLILAFAADAYKSNTSGSVYLLVPEANK